MTVTLRHLRAFVEIANHGSFRRAAEVLCISQPALTITINQFEDLSSVKLFKRTTRRVKLTDAGAAFLPVAKNLIDDFDQAIDNLENSARRLDQQVVISVLPSLTTKLLPDLLAQFKDTNPDINIILKDENSFGVQRQVLNNEVDFGISNIWEPEPRLDYTALSHDPMVLVCPDDHPLGDTSAPIAWQELNGFPFVGMNPNTGIHKLINSVEACPDSVHTPEYEVLTMACLSGIINQNLAISVLPLLAVPKHMHATMVLRKLVSPSVERELCVITRHQSKLSEPAAMVRDMLLNEVPDRVH